MAIINKATDYHAKSDDLFFFDTNIWMFLFAPIAEIESKKQNIYGTLLKDIQSANAKIKISSLIISEFINASLKLCFRQWQDANNNYKTTYKKDFKGTEEYYDAVEDAKNNAISILKITNKIPDGFLSVDIEKIFSDIEDKDFNDAYYLEICKINKLKLVTDDIDLLSSGDYNIEIITERKYVKS